MLSGVCIGTNNLSAAGDFYDEVLATIGMKCVLSDPQERGYAGADGRMTLFVLVPYNKQKATFGNGSQVMFYAADEEAVRTFHATALRCGGTDEGAPGPRSYHPKYYGAYVRDLDGNKLNVSVSLEHLADI
jgi:catechol 2,3-dioxygenase-like lactoylglutathione lyase family enzyme